MEDSGAILCQLSSLKDMLDQVNEEIEANIKITREIESEIVKWSESETTLAAREAELTKTLYMLQFEINGFLSVTADSTTSVEHLVKELCCLRMKHEDLVTGMYGKSEEFYILCQEFQKAIGVEENDPIRALISEKELLENEVYQLEKKNYALENSVLALVEEILDDLQNSNSALQLEIDCKNRENENLMKDIDDLKSTLLASIISNDDA